MIDRLIRSLFAATAIAALAPAAATAAIIAPNVTADEYTDNANCSLREAIQSANVDGVAQFEPDCTAGTGNDTIQLGSTTYQLSIPLGPNDITAGDLEVLDSDTLTVQGTGSGTSVIDGGDVDRVFDLTGTGAVTLDSLTERDGFVGANGGGIFSTTDLTLQDAVVDSNQTTGGSSNGGGILITGATSDLILNTSTVSANLAGGTGGGIEVFGGATLTANDASIGGNFAGSQGGGIDNQNGTGNITLNAGTAIEDNDATALGGGIAVTTGANLIVNGASFENNDVVESGSGLASGGGIHYINSAGPGQLQLTDAYLDNNTATGDEATGGGINAVINSPTGGASLLRTFVVNNDVTVDDDGDNGQTEGGGGLTLDGVSPVTITDSLFGANTVTVNDPQDFAGGGGILDFGSLTLNRTTFQTNDISAGAPPAGWNGGGLYAFQPDGPTQVLNSTFFGNMLGISGTGAGFASGGSQPTTLVHSAFSGNVGGLGDSFNPFGTGSFTVRANVFDDGATSCFPDPLPGVNGFNVDPGTSCVGAPDDTDLENTDPTLGPLVDNGGPLLGGIGESTRTLELSGPASVFDLVPPASCQDLASAPLTVDQRGAVRPTDAGCEPGSYEIVRCLGMPAYIGTPGDDTISGVFFFPTAFHGLGGNDTIFGKPDANRICGGSGNDILNGLAGNDMIDGGSGGDQLLGDADMDNLFARDGEADVVNCGTEADTAQTDRLSLDAVTGCESVDALAEPPVVTPPTTTTPTAENPQCAALRAKLKKAKSKRKKKKLRKKLRALGC